MGKDWDKAVPSVDIWKECLRVLKPGAFMCVMSAPRSDVQNAMISRLMEAGFRLDFTPIYWTYASGFPKSMNMGKAADAKIRTGISEPKAVRASEMAKDSGELYSRQTSNYGIHGEQRVMEKRRGTDIESDQAKALEGSYAGFQPKPAVEVIIVAMKPLSEKTYVDQALANGHGISWLDDARIPTETSYEPTPSGLKRWNEFSEQHDGSKRQVITGTVPTAQGRFPANLCISDDALGTDYSRFFTLDRWAETLPFLVTPKASKSEKNKGLEDLYQLKDDTPEDIITEIKQVLAV